ncbi:hypothetical protein [Streptomyces lydicus]|uniref:hypothetical protein n=1 Tax=Streptomyces lydicus TaxID=47763 RepID=UPI0036ED31C8
MDSGAQPKLIRDLQVRADYGQIYIYSAASFDDDPQVSLDALEDARGSRRFVGTAGAGGFIDLLTPGQWNWKTPVRLEVFPAEPKGDTDEWEHEVDVDLDVPDGRLWFEPAGGSGNAVETKVPAGEYRVRVSGRGFAALGRAGAEGSDSYRLRLWARTTDAPAALRKFWSGWENYR